MCPPNERHHRLHSTPLSTALKAKNYYISLKSSFITTFGGFLLKENKDSINFNFLDYLRLMKSLPMPCKLPYAISDNKLSEGI